MGPELSCVSLKEVKRRKTGGDGRNVKVELVLHQLPPFPAYIHKNRDNWEGKIRKHVEGNAVEKTSRLIFYLNLNLLRV